MFLLKNSFAFILALIFSSTIQLNAKNQSREYDIMIYGGTSAGIAAAILSSRMGKSVLVIEPSSSIGVASKKKN
jgi:heterodisulfide reductase subunit A-like polyferredoxin